MGKGIQRDSFVGRKVIEMTTKGIEREAENYGMSKKDFDKLVKEEVERYKPLILEYARDHSKDECLDKTHEWFQDYLISGTTEDILDECTYSKFGRT